MFLAAVLFSALSLAAGTPPGTIISNAATSAQLVGAAPQTASTNSVTVIVAAPAAQDCPY